MTQDEWANMTQDECAKKSWEHEQQTLAYKEWGLYNTKHWQLHFCLWPRTCYLSGQRLWLKRCYKGTRQIRQDIEFSFDEYYIEIGEFIFWNLKRKK